MTSSPWLRRVVVVLFTLAIALTLSVRAGAIPSGPPSQDEPIVWYDEKGKPLPFQDVETIMMVLSDAKIVKNKKIDIGVTGPRRLVLEHNGVRLNAAFRNVDAEHSRVRLPDGTYFQKLHDFNGFEVCAYRISLMLDMDNVPPAVHRTVDREDGTVQLWVEDTMMEQERTDEGLRAPNRLAWMRQTQEMMIFDDLIGNVDRNPGNLLIDKNWKVWLIDHTRAFQQGDEVKNAERILFVRQGLWDGLQALDREAVTEATGDILDRGDIDDIFKRRDLLVERIQGLIDERGSEAVLWQ